ncbi:hypothetical protein C8Q75DRAFT_703062, partial [Abortiporus biennis]
LIQLRTGHISLNYHLHRINCSPTLRCPFCDQEETVRHFLLYYPKYRHHWAELNRKLRKRAYDTSYMLSHPNAIKSVIRFVAAMNRL